MGRRNGRRTRGAGTAGCRAAGRGRGRRGLRRLHRPAADRRGVDGVGGRGGGSEPGVRGGRLRDDRDRPAQHRGVGRVPGVGRRGCPGGRRRGIGRRRCPRRRRGGVGIGLVATPGRAGGGTGLRFDRDDAADAGQLAVDIRILGVLIWSVVEDVDRGDGVRELDLHALQGTGERDGGLEAVAGALGHRSLEHRLQRRRGVGALQARHRLAFDPLDEIGAAVAAAGLLERRPAGQQGVHRRAEGVDVGRDARLWLVGERLRRRPRNRHAGRRLHGIRRGRDAEVRERGTVVFRDENVRRFDVAMQDAGAMRRLDGRRDLHPDAERLGHRERRGARAHLQVRARAVLHDEVRPAVVGDPCLIDRDDRRMRRQQRHHVRLGGELLGCTSRHAALEHDLHRDAAPWQMLLVEVDVGEAARPENVEVGEPRECRRRRGRTLRGAHGRSSKATVTPSPRSSTSPVITMVGSPGCSRTGS